MSVDDDRLRSQFAAEFAALAARTDAIRLLLSPFEAWVLIGQLQLALRHPANTGPSAQIAKILALRLQSIVAPDGVLALIAARGWHAEYDEE